MESTFFAKTNDWQDLDNYWALNFLKEAEKLELNRNTLNILNEKVRLFYFARKGNF